MGDPGKSAQNNLLGFLVQSDNSNSGHLAYQLTNQVPGRLAAVRVRHEVRGEQAHAEGSAFRLGGASKGRPIRTKEGCRFGGESGLVVSMGNQKETTDVGGNP